MLEVFSAQGLLSAAQWNVIEFHTLNTSSKSFEHPDRMVFDLDPGEGVTWPQIQEAAELMRSFLDQLGLPAFLKTSGGKGLHIVVPLRKVHDWDTVKRFSQAVVNHVAKTVPQRFVARSGAKNRVGRIFIDYLRNGLGATTACAWSARARPGLGISVPCTWDELGTLRGGDHWTIRSVHTRLDKGNEPWADYAAAACRLTAAMKLLGFPAG
jgi:bifunctional non-homologous end joining protein LigD